MVFYLSSYQIDFAYFAFSVFPLMLLFVLSFYKTINCIL